MIRSALIAALLALTLTACNKPATAPVVEAPAATTTTTGTDAASAVTTTTTAGTDAASAVTTTTTTAPAAK